jgi:bile acid:Na+ symporter, BASS family
MAALIDEVPHKPMRELILITLQVSIMCTVFGFGLAASAADLLYLARRPGLVARSLLSVFVIMPIFTLGLVRLLEFPLTTEAVLLALSMSAVPPLLKMKETKAGGHASFGLGLMVVLSFASIAAVPAAVAIMERFFERPPIVVAPAAIAGVVMKSTLAPLAAGLAVSAIWPAIASWLEKPVAVISNVLLPLAVVALVAGGFSEIWAAVGNGTVLAIVIFTVAGLAIGHVLGGPDPDHSAVLALSTACRHPAMALAIATTAIPDQRFGATILLYLLVNIVAGLPYIVWQRRRTGAPSAA